MSGSLAALTKHRFLGGHPQFLTEQVCCASRLCTSDTFAGGADAAVQGSLFENHPESTPSLLGAGQMPSKTTTTPCFLRESCPLTVILPGSTRARMLPPPARKRPPHEGVGEVTKASPQDDPFLQAFSRDLTQSIPGSSPAATFSPLPDTWMLSRGLPVSGHSL